MKQPTQRIKNLLPIFCLILILSACAPFQPSSYPAPQQTPSTSTQSSTKPAQNPTPSTQEIAPVRADSASNNEAVSALIDQAWQLHNEGVYDRSNAMAERAQRLSASTAEVYLIMASNYFSLAELGLAKQLARQGLHFTQNNWVIERRLKNLLQRITRTGS